MSIPGLFQEFNILPYRSISHIEPASRRRAFCQQVQAYWNEKRILKDNSSKDSAPYFKQLRDLDEKDGLIDIDDADFANGDSWIVGIIRQRKAKLEVVREEEYEESSCRRENEGILRDQKERDFVADMQRQEDREKREDKQEDARKELIEEANKAARSLNRV